MAKYLIKGSYQGRTETIDESETRVEARRLLAEYQQAFGPTWSLWIVVGRSKRGKSN